MPISPLLFGLVVLGLVIACWIIALVRRQSVTGDEQVLLDIASPPVSDWVVLGLCLAAAIAMAVIGLRLELDPWPGLLFPLSLALAGALMFVDNLPAAVTARGLRRGLSITPWSQFAGWQWDDEQPHTLVLSADRGDSPEPVVAVPVTDPAKADGAPETPTLPSPDDYPDWDSFRAVIDASLGQHLSATTTPTPTATPTPAASEPSA